MFGEGFIFNKIRENFIFLEGFHVNKGDIENAVTVSLLFKKILKLKTKQIIIIEL